jgi:hypothetical protein
VPVSSPVELVCLSDSLLQRSLEQYDGVARNAIDDREMRRIRGAVDIGIPGAGG